MRIYMKVGEAAFMHQSGGVLLHRRRFEVWMNEVFYLSLNSDELSLTNLSPFAAIPLASSTRAADFVL